MQKGQEKKANPRWVEAPSAETIFSAFEKSGFDLKRRPRAVKDEIVEGLFDYLAWRGNQPPEGDTWGLFMEWYYFFDELEKLTSNE